MTWLDYKHLKSVVNINQVLGYYGIDLQRVGETHLKGTCPLPDHTGDRSNPNAFHVDTAKNAFNCFTHCGGGNVIDFVAKMESCDFRQAALKLHEEFLSDVSAPQETDDQGSGEKADQPNAVNDPLTFELKGLNAKHPFLRKTKGLTPDTIKTFGLGFCTKGLLAGWIAIPVHNNIGERVAYVGRSISSTQAESEGKYKFPPGFKKSLEIFNLYRVLQSRETIEKYGRIIVEGFFGAFWLHQCGFKNVVALDG